MALTSGTTPAASLAIIVKANTAAATAGLAKVDAQGRAVAATSGNLTRSTSRTSTALRKLGTVAKYGGAALAVGFVYEAKKAVTTTQELTKSTISLHKNLGLSNKQASEWAGLAKARGVDSTKLGMAFKTLATQITAARDGSATSITMFKRLGFSQKDVARAAQDTEFAVKKAADGIKNLGAGADRTAIEGKLFGRGWQTIAPIMRDGSKEMQKQLDLVQKYGGVLEGKTLKQQEALLANIRENKIAWQGFQVTLSSLVTPALNKVSDQFQRIAAINASKHLTGEEKFKRISRIIRHDLQRALDFFLKLIPVMANNVGKAAPQIAMALVKGFLGADIWGKLFLGAWFFRKVGLSNALFSKMGKRYGKTFGKFWAVGLVLALPLLIPAAYKLGEKIGKAIRTKVRTIIREMINWIIDRLNSVTGAINSVIGAFNKLPGPDIGEIGDIGHVHPGRVGGTTPRERRQARARARADAQRYNYGRGYRRATGGQHGGVVTAEGIIPVGFQRGGMVGGRGRRPGPRDTVNAWLEPGEMVIPKKVVEDTRKNAKLAAVAMTGELGKGTKGALKNAVEFVKKHGVSMKQMKDTAGKLTMGFRKATVDDFTKTKQQGGQQTDALKQRATDDFNRLHKNVTDQMDKTKTQSIKASKDTAKGVGKNYGNMVGAVNDGLNKLAKMTNNALKALGVNEVNFGIKTAKPGRHKRGGEITDPTAPMSGDHIPALLERGEFVVNRKAAKKHRRSLEAINFADAPRFAVGGTAGMQPNAAALANQFVQKFGGAISSGLRPGDSGFHGRGMAFDWVPGDANAATSFANQIGSQILEGIHNPAAWGKQVSWDSGSQVSPSFWGGATWADHVDHLHVAVAQKVAGAVIKKLKRVLLTGPDGPLKDMGQASLDKVQKAANAYIAKHAAAQGPEVGPGGTFSKTDLMKLWRSTGSGGSASIMAAIALGESSGNPRAVGHDPGGTEGLGLWQITTGFNDALIARLGGKDAMFDPVKNAKAAHSIFDSQGYGAWVVYNTGAYRQFLKKGGFAGMQGGGNGKNGKPDVTGRDVTAGLGGLSVKNLFKLMGDLAKGPAAGHEGLRSKVSKMLLKDIAEVRKGTPVRPKGHLHDYLNELDVLTLKMKLHKKGKPHEEAFQNLVEWLGDPEDGFYTWQTLRNRKKKWHNLQIRKQIAAKTPNPKDDIRIAKLIADFLGKKPGDKVDTDAAARTQQLFDFLKLLGPVTSLSTFGRGGKLGSGKFGIAGESGPELIRGPATISSPQETSSMLSPAFDVRVFIGGRELTDIVDVQINRSDRAKDLKRRTGVSPAR